MSIRKVTHLFYFVMNGKKLLTFDSNFFHLLRHVQNAYFSKIQMKAIPKIVLVREVSTVTEFKLMFVLCFVFLRGF
jgi:hypothetical protein